MKNFPNSGFLKKSLIRRLISSIVLIFSSMLYFNAHGQAICDTIAHIRTDYCVDTIYNDSCLIRKYNFFFLETDTTSNPTSFFVNDLQVTLDLNNSLFGYIDDNLSTVNAQSNDFTLLYLNNNTRVQIRPSDGCDDVGSPYVLPIGDCSNPFAEIYVISTPGESPGFIIRETLGFLSTPSLPNSCGENICTIDRIQPAFNENVANGTSMQCDTSLVIKLQPFEYLGEDTLVSDPHQAVQLEVILYNLGTEDITINDYDIRVVTEDLYENLFAPLSLPDFYNLFEVPTPNSGGQAQEPYIEVHDQNGDYFFLDEMNFPGQTVAAGDSVIILVFTVPPPELSNEYGLADFTVDFVRLSYEDTSGIQCCTVNVNNPTGVVEFPGDLPCDTEPTVTFKLQPNDSLYADCELNVDVCIEVRDSTGSPDSIAISELFIDLKALLSGNMTIDRITGLPSPFSYTLNDCTLGVLCPGGGTDCKSCTAEISFEDNDFPFRLKDTCFTLTLRGAEGTVLEDIGLDTAYIRVAGDTTRCLPQIDVDASDLIDAEISCESCLNYTVYVDEYGGSTSLDSCESGFSVYLNVPDGNDLDSIHVELEFNNPNNATIESIQSVLCQTNNQCVPAEPAGATQYDSCVYLDGNTIVYQYCPVFGITGGTRTLFHVIFSGDEGDCINDINFTMNTAIGGDTSATCIPADTTGQGNNEFCIEASCVTQVGINGIIRTPVDTAVEIPVLPVGAELPGDLSEIRSGVFILTEPRGSGSICVLDSLPADTIDGVCDTLVPAVCNDGAYSAELNCATDTTYIIQPYKDIDYLGVNSKGVNSVTTFDLVLISQHILGTSPFTSPYQHIAADANGDEKVSTFDILELRQLILQIIDDLPKNTSWRFVDQSYVFPILSDPLKEDWPECIEANSANGYSNKNFVGIKIGDVNFSNGDCSSNLFTSGGGALPRVENVPTNKSVEVSLSPSREEIHEDDLFHLDLVFQSSTSLAAWQLGLKFDPSYLQFEQAVPSASLPGMVVENFGLTEVEQGKIRTLWFDPEGRAVDFEEGITAMRLTFKAWRPIGNVLSHLQIDPQEMETMAFEVDGKKLDIKLSEAQPVNSPHFTAAPIEVQVIPNPFHDRLAFTFQNTSVEKGEIRIHDLLGKEVAVWRGAILPQEPIFFENTSTWGSGVLIWKVKIGADELNGKVIRK